MKKILSQRGIALILVISSISMLSIMMVEFTFNSQMNLKISYNYKNATKAKELARSGINFALLELTVYKKIREHPIIKKIPGFNEGMLDIIWQFGFIYPPPATTSKATFGQERAVKEFVEKSQIDGNIHVEIYDESTKINLNDLADPKYQRGIYRQLDAIFQRKLSEDEDFNEKYQDYRFDELVQHIIDWIDKDNSRQGGGDESYYYDRLPVIYEPKNRPLDTLSELALVEKLDNDEIFDLLRPYVTVYPTGGINVNAANHEMLLTISPELTPEDVENIIEKREKEGYFKDAADFENYCKKTLLKSANFNKNPKVPLSSRSSIFSLSSTAEVKGARQTIHVVINLENELPNGSPEILYWNIN